MEKQSAEWEEIFAYHISHKSLLSTLYRSLLQLSNEMTTQLKTEQSIWIFEERYFFKEDTEIGQKHMKRC